MHGGDHCIFIHEPTVVCFEIVCWNNQKECIYDNGLYHNHIASKTKCNNTILKLKIFARLRFNIGTKILSDYVAG